jgi:integrase
MVQNRIRRFVQFASDDGELLAEDARFGRAELVDGVSRLKSFLDNAWKAGVELPVRHNDRLSSSRLLDIALIPKELASEPRIRWLIAKAVRRWKKASDKSQRERANASCPKPVPLTKGSLYHCLRPFEELHQMRRRIPGDCLIVRPFSQGARALADEIGDEDGQTATIPHEQALDLIEKSARWVLDYSIPLLRCRDKVHEIVHQREFGKSDRRGRFWKVVDADARAFIPQATEFPWVLSASVRPRGLLRLDTALRNLGIAAFTTIAAFTARRNREITGVEENCVSQNSEGLWIETLIEKTLQEDDRTPCPEIVLKAIRVLQELSAPARKITGSPRLAQYVGADPHKAFQINFNDLGAFANFVEVKPLPDGSRWKFCPHQFRRFFSIVFFWVWALGDLPALGYHLRHFNQDATRRYVRSAIKGAMAAKDNFAFTREIVIEFILGARTLHGRGGHKLSDQLEKTIRSLRGRVRILYPDRITGAVTQLLEEAGIVFQPNPWAFCVIPRDLSEPKLPCQADASKRNPDINNAGPVTCAGCPFAVMIGGQVTRMQEELKRNEELTSDMRLPATLREAASIRCDTIRHAIKEHA